MLGIKTADYEYNPKKKNLTESLERHRLQLTILFWFNFLVFYVIIIFVPIHFVLVCEGHDW